MRRAYAVDDVRIRGDVATTPSEVAAKHEVGDRLALHDPGDLQQVVDDGPREA